MHQGQSRQSTPSAFYLQQLRKVELLENLPDATFDKLLQKCQFAHFKAGNPIIERNDERHDVLFILKGCVRVYDSTSDGREITFAEISAGGHVGELAAIDNGPRSANVTAANDCLVGSISAKSFHSLLEQCPLLSLRLLQRFAKVIRQADSRITELCTTGTIERLCRELLIRANRADEHGRLFIEELPTQQILASAIGSTRETVAKGMAFFQNAGLIRRAGRKLYIEDLVKLKTMANVSFHDS